MPGRPPVSSPSLPLVTTAVLDDTQHLWIAFLDRSWLWADLAGYLKDQGQRPSVVHPPLRGVQEGPELQFGSQLQLPLALLTTRHHEAMGRGVLVRARRRTPGTWYCPLHLTGTVTAPHRPTLPGPLAAHPALDLAVRAHLVSREAFIRRLSDLCALIAASGRPVAATLLAPWPLEQRDLSTPWDALTYGQIGLVEQVLAPGPVIPRPLDL